MSILVVVRPQRTRRSLTPTPDVHEDAPAPFASSPPMVSQERNDVTFQLLMSSPHISTSGVPANPRPLNRNPPPFSCQHPTAFPILKLSSSVPNSSWPLPFPSRQLLSTRNFFLWKHNLGDTECARGTVCCTLCNPKHFALSFISCPECTCIYLVIPIPGLNSSSVCTRANCPQPSSGSSTQAHEKNYHSVKHTVFYDGIKTTIHRREDGKLPCPCGSEVHARYNFQKWSNLNRQLPHPGSESSPYPDEPTTHDAAAPYPDSIQSRPEAFAASPAPPLVETSQANQSLRATTRNPEESCQDDPSADVDMPPEPIPTLPQTPAETVAYLARFNIAVEPTCLLTICTECHSLVEHVHIQTHQRRLHFRGLNLPAENRLPSNAIIQSLLSSLGAHQPRPIPEGGIPCPPGVNTVQGYKCSIPGCPPMVYGAERTFRKHWSLHHPTLAVHDRHSTRVQCFPLNTQHHDGTYIEAIPATISNAPSSAMQHIHASAENCDLRSHTQLFSVSTNARRKGAVFAQSRWNLAIDGINCRQVANTSSKA
ncbi:hypothetical protein FB446DRAFT_710035, partial [Lentinula raphanica]